MAKVKKKVAKVKKKYWFKVVAPKVFDEQILGETYVSEASLMKNKAIKLNLKCFSDKSKRRNVSVGFIVDSVKDNMAYCKLISYKLLYASIKRLISRGKEKILESFVVKSKDDQNIRVKLIAITLKKTSNSVLTSIRKELSKIVARVFGSLNYEEILMQTVDYKIQIQIKRELSKIYPLRACEITELHIERGKKIVVVERSVEEDKKPSTVVEDKKPSTVEEEKKIVEKKQTPSKEKEKEKVVEKTTKKKPEVKVVSKKAKLKEE